MSDELAEDEPWRIWHRAASEQLSMVVSGLTADPLPTLHRAQEFSELAKNGANDLELIVTEAIVEAIHKVRAKLTEETPDADVR